MKKYLFLVLSILSIFFISDSVDALSFTVNGEEVEISEENLIYYIYSQKKDLFNSYDYFYLLDKGDNLSYYIYFTNFPNFTSLGFYRYGCNGASSSNVCVFVENSIYNSTKDYVWSNTSTYENTLTKHFNISNYGSAHIIASNYENLVNNGYEYSLLSKKDLSNFFGIKYSINFYVDNNLYKTYKVDSNSSFDISQVEYIPPKNYKFNGWDLVGIDLSNITSDINIYGTTSYVRPNMNYSEDIDSVIHELSVSIIGKNVPVEFDYIYTVMDYIILIVLVLCVIAPFVIIIKLLSGRW